MLTFLGLILFAAFLLSFIMIAVPVIDYIFDRYAFSPVLQKQNADLKEALAISWRHAHWEALHKRRMAEDIQNQSRANRRKNRKLRAYRIANRALRDEVRNLTK